MCVLSVIAASQRVCKYGKHFTHPHEVVPLVQVTVEIVVLH